MFHTLNLLRLFCLLTEQLYRTKMSAWKKHFQALTFEYNQTDPFFYYKQTND